MRSTLFVLVVVAAAGYTGFVGATECLALQSVTERGKWPESWPRELEPYRRRATTIQFPVGGSDTYVIPVLDSEDFGALWPAVMKVKSKGGTITLRSGDKPEVRIVGPLFGLSGEFKGGTKYTIDEAWLASVERTEGMLPDRASLDSDGKWRDSKKVSRHSLPFKARTDLELVVYGDVTSPAHIPLPPDAPIIDQRNTGREKSAEYAPRVAVQLYIWIQDRAKKNIDLWEDLDAVLGEVGQIGATAIEGYLEWFSTEERARRTESLLKKHGLRLAGLYAKGTFHEPDKAQEAIDLIVVRARRARALNPEFIDVNPDPLPGKARKTEEQLHTQARMLNELGRALRKMHLRLVVHQHDAEILHNAREQRANVLWTDPRLVGFCLDTHWVYRGGQDPLELIKEAGDRVGALHLRNSVNGVWTETLGPGDIDHKAIASYLRRANYDGWLVLELAYEKDTKITRPLMENIRHSLNYVDTVFLGIPSSQPSTTTATP